MIDSYLILPLQQLLHFVQQLELQHVLRPLLHVKQQHSLLELQQQSLHIVQPKQLLKLQMRLYFFPKMYMNILSLNLLGLKSTALGWVL